MKYSRGRAATYFATKMFVLIHFKDFLADSYKPCLSQLKMHNGREGKGRKRQGLSLQPKQRDSDSSFAYFELQQGTVLITEWISCLFSLEMFWLILPHCLFISSSDDTEIDLQASSISGK